MARSILLPWVVVVFMAGAPLGVTAQATAQDSSAVMANARRAVGGSAGTRSVRSLVMTGTVRRLNGMTETLEPPEPVELKVLLPDGYVRTVRGARFIRRTGFGGESVINEIRSVVPGASTATHTGAGQLGRERAFLANLMLGLLARTDAPLPLSLRPNEQGATGLVVEGPDGFRSVVELDSASQVPQLVRFQGLVPVNVTSVVNGKTSTVAPVLEPAEIALVFSDRREVGGLQLAHRITRQAGGRVLEEMTFTQITLNGGVTAADLRIRLLNP